MALLRRNSCYGAMEWIFKILCLFGMLWNPTGSASSSLLGMGGGKNRNSHGMLEDLNVDNHR